MSEDLERCPFCGSRSSIDASCDHSTAWEGGCANSDCPIQPSVWQPTKAEAIAAWNRRAPAQPGPSAPGEHDWTSDKVRTLLDLPYLTDEKASVIAARLNLAWYAEHGAAQPEPVNPNTGHGHVRPRPDGVRMRCGGPGVCAKCSREKAAMSQPEPAAPTVVEPDWDDIREQAEEATGLKVERHTYSIVIREVRKWLAATPPRAALTDEQIDAAYRKYGTGRPDGFAAAVRELIGGPRNE